MAVPLLAQVWAELLGAPDAVDRVRARGSAGLGGPLPVGQLAVGTAVAHLLAARELRSRGAPGELADQYLHLDAAHVGVEFGSERHLRVDGVPRAGGFAPLSRAWPTSDGWVRTHANYPHHRAALLAALGLDAGGGDEATSPRLAAALAERSALDVEEVVTAAGGLAVAVRTPQEWSATPMGAAVARSPLVSLRRVGDGAAQRARGGAGSGAGSGVGSGAEGVEGARVLDLTRVIAGPTATRALAAHGADVLRVDPPHLPELPEQWLETGPGKRCCELDLAAPAGRACLEELLAGADVLVHGYRPGALARHGLDEASLAERHPHLVVASLSAWGEQGPWAHRRGFDSLVQAASGVAVMSGGADGRPGALPVQALDHAAGQLLAAAVLRALALRRDGGTWHASTSLAAQARWLLANAVVSASDAPQPPPAEAPQAERYLVEVPSPDGALTVVRPLGAAPWASGPVRTAAEWLPR
nr:CoA transferase [Quadrisphaera sp. INWT6]